MTKRILSLIVLGMLSGCSSSNLYWGPAMQKCGSTEGFAKKECRSGPEYDAERKKADRATSRSKQSDPDNPTLGAGGRADATASPNPIGSHHGSKNAVAGGSNPGIDV